MNLKSISIKGLCSFKDMIKFEFEPNTLFLITGRNGSGKSTLFSESFSFLLRGQLLRQDSVV